MNNHEKVNQNVEDNLESVREAGEQQADVLREKHEKANELSPESNETTGARARMEALENAISAEKKLPSKEVARPSSHRGAINKRDLDATYHRTMDQVQSELSAPSRAFSKFIHLKAVEKVSDTLGTTVARPNAVLAGAIAAFIVTLALYLIAKNYGYRLSGFETIGGFILGWILGLLFDYFRVMITGKRSQ